VLLSKDRQALAHPTIAAAAKPLPAKPGIRAWTDDFHDLVSVLR
jgi:hypothetical protein